MALNVYEGMFILDSARFGRDPEGVANQITKLVEDVGGEIIVSRLWEERRLAYPINGQRRGVYWLTYFQVDSAKMEELNRSSSLFDANLRHLFIKIDARIVDALVEHAKAGPAALQDRPLPEVEVDDETEEAVSVEDEA